MNTANRVAKKRVTNKELLLMGLVPWNCTKTTIRKVKSEHFPGYQDADGIWYFDPKEVEIWFKARKHVAS